MKILTAKEATHEHIRRVQKPNSCNETVRKDGYIMQCSRQAVISILCLHKSFCRVHGGLVKLRKIK